MSRKESTKFKMVSSDTNSEAPVLVTKIISLSSTLSRFPISKKPCIINNIEDDYIEVNIGLSKESQNKVHELCKKIKINELEFTKHIIEEMLTEEYNERHYEYSEILKGSSERERNILSSECLAHDKYCIGNNIFRIWYMKDRPLTEEENNIFQRQMGELSFKLSKLKIICMDIFRGNFIIYLKEDNSSRLYMLYKIEYDDIDEPEISFNLSELHEINNR